MMVFPPTFGVMELIIILVIILIIFGPRKLPEIGKALGQGIRELRSSTKDKDEEQQDKPSDEMKATEAETEKSEPKSEGGKDKK